MSLLQDPHNTADSRSTPALLSTFHPMRSSIPVTQYPEPSISPSLPDPPQTSSLTPLERAQDRWRTLFRLPSKPDGPPTARPTTLNTLNSRTNEPWGDVLQDKEEDVTRVYVTNLNGLHLDERGGKFDSVCRTLRDIKADIFCAQEHNVDTTQVALRNIIFDTARQHWERHRIVIGTSPIQFKTAFKPGGTLVLTTGSVTGRICKQIRDKWGRRSGQEYLCHGGRKLVVLSVYQPIVKGGMQGKITVAAQHVSLVVSSNDKSQHCIHALHFDETLWRAYRNILECNMIFSWPGISMKSWDPTQKA